MPKSLGSILTARYGVKMPEQIHENSTAAPTIQKMPPAYSPVVDFERPIGRKPTTVISAPVRRGMAVD
ncbi:hypothetical protein D3C71_1733740 [compost metagenome]